ncbi:MAG: glycosyltransferase family 39 protein [Chloroflexi bacterium]|nr:glycosyltransferase family 39 protein [Chloroflexota bacterium]
MTRWRERFGVLLLLLIGMGLAMWAASTQAGTYDEVTFLGVGRYLWHTGDFDIQHARFHPPLMYYVNSLFLELGPGRWDLGRDASGHFTYFAGRGYLYHSGQSPDAVLLLARYPFILLFVLLGSVLYRWGKEVHGPGGALLSLALYVFSPTVLAHASIAGNDFLLTTLYTLTLFALWQATRRGGIGRWALVGVLWGGTLLTKATGMVLWALIPALVMWSWWLARKQAWPRPLALKRILVETAGAGVLAVVTVMAGYGFHGLYAFSPQYRPHRWVDRLVGWMGPGVRDAVYALIERPIPGYRYVTMLLRQFGHVTQGHEAFLLGHRSRTGWWYFFPVAMSVKTPVGTLLLWLGGLGRSGWMAWRSSGRERWQTWGWIGWWGLPILFIAGPAMWGRANMGVRLILPLYPFLFLFAGALTSSRAPLKRGRWVVWLLVGWTAVSVLLQAPRYLSYVNELWGGPEAGWRYVGDSNYDWGQSLKELREYLEEEGIQEIYLAYFGGELPEMRGIRYRPLPCHPVRGVVVISTTYLQGLYLDNPECYAWLRAYKPVKRLGHTLWVFRIR